MSFSIEKTSIGQDIVISGWEDGVLDNPYTGIYDMRNCDAVTIPGEVSVGMSTQLTTTPIAITNVTITVDNTTSIFTYNGTIPLVIGTAVTFSNSGGALPAGLSATAGYYILTTPSPTTFTISLSYGGAQKLVTDNGSGTNKFSAINMGTPTEIKGINVPILKIGDAYGGGTIAYILQAGDPGYIADNVQRGLIVSSTLVSSGVYWHSADSTSVATNTAIGTGQANTTAIIAAYGAEVNAAEDCDNFVSGAFSDWYLPSKDELNLVYINQKQIGGINSNLAYWSSSQFSASQAYGQNFSSGYQGGINKSSAQPVLAMRSFTSPYITTQSAYVAVDDTGRVWAYEVGVTSNWVYLNNLASELVTNTYNNIISWKGYIFLFTGVNLGYIVFNSLSAMSTKSNWNLTLKGITQANIHQALAGQDDAVYFCNSNAIGSILENAGQIFDPTLATTYTYNIKALKLPSTDSATCLAELGTNLMVGGENNFIYPWNRIATSFTFPIFLSENYTTRLVTINTTMYIFCGYKGRIFVTNGANATPFFKIAEYLSNTTNPYIVWTDANFNRNQLYFGFKVTNNAGTTINTYGGLWAVDVDSVSPVAPRLQNIMSYGTYAGYVSAICQFRGTNYATQPAGDGYGLFTGWFSGSIGGIDIGISTPYTGGQSYVICDPIPIGQYLTNKTLSGIEYKLGAPLATNETVTLGYRTQLSGAFTDNALDPYVAGSLSQWGTVKFEKSQWIQLQAILTSTATNPSYCRVREIRIHLS